MFGRKTWCTKKPFGYRVAHHGYLLTSCQRQVKEGKVKKHISYVNLRTIYFKYKISYFTKLTLF